MQDSFLDYFVAQERIFSVVVAATVRCDVPVLDVVNGVDCGVVFHVVFHVVFDVLSSGLPTFLAAAAVAEWG